MSFFPTRRFLACAATSLLLVALAGCGSLRTASLSSPETLFGLLQPYEIDVVQGNVVTEEIMAQIQPGLRRNQVREILGSPLLADVFHGDRWDYVFTIRRQGVPPQQRAVTIFFENDLVERFEADSLPSEREFVASIDKPGKLARVKPDLTEAQVSALPVPAKVSEQARVPQGPLRDYPPLDQGQP